jgi:hypothetical protein
MANLQVEELEPRQLLNSTGFSHQPPPSHVAPAGAFAGRVVERAPSVDLGGGHAGPVRQGRPGEGGVEIGPSRGTSPHYPGGRAREAPYLHAPARPDHEKWSTPGASRGIDSRGESTTFAVAGTDSGAEGGAARTETSGSGVTRGGAGLPGAGLDAAGGAETARTEAGPTLPAPPEPADGSSGADVASAEAVAGTPSGRPNVQPLPALESLVAAVGLCVEVQGPPAARPPVGTVREGEGLFYGPDPLVRRYQLSSPGAATTPAAAPPEGGQAGEGPVPPSPQVSGLLTALPPFDLSALELGMQQFLEELEGMGRRLARHPGAAGLCLWIVAGGTAAVACEIARRQLRPPADGPAVALPGSPPDPSFAR